MNPRDEQPVGNSDQRLSESACYFPLSRCAGAQVNWLMAVLLLHLLMPDTRPILILKWAGKGGHRP